LFFYLRIFFLLLFIRLLTVIAVLVFVLGWFDHSDLLVRHVSMLVVVSDKNFLSVCNGILHDVALVYHFEGDLENHVQ